MCGAAEGLACEGFVEFEIGCTVAIVAAFEECGIEAGEDEELVSGGDLEVEAHGTFGGGDDGEEVRGVGEAAGDILEEISGGGGDAFGEDASDVVGDIGIG